MIKFFLKLFGFHRSEKDKQIAEIVKNSYKSLRIVGRGGLVIDPKEVRQSKEFKEAIRQVQNLKTWSKNEIDR